jgi:hypothetical protein
MASMPDIVSGGGPRDGADVVIDDLMFRPLSNLNPTTAGNELVIGISGASGTTYDVELWAHYECYGSLNNSLKPSFQDSRGWDLICNALAHKRLSGWLGEPHEAQLAYQHAVVSTAAAADDVSKETEKSIQRVTAKQKDEHSVLRDMYDVAKDVASFVLPMVL